MFIDRKLECQILACATSSPKNGVRVDDAREIVNEKRPDTQDYEFFEHLKRLHELKYVDCTDCNLGFNPAERMFTNGMVQYTVTSKGEEYLQAMLDSDLFEF